MPCPKAICLFLASVLTALLIFSSSTAGMAQEAAQVVKITAKRFEYSPNTITLKKGVPVVLEFTSLDRLHGFFCPDFKIRTDITPGKVNTVRFVPDKTGTFTFHCDIFCGSGHESMAGKFVVTD